MARHLLIGNDAAVSYDANGLLADGAIDIQKLSSDGPTSLGAGDTIADSDQIRIVQGGPTDIDVNIVSPWIYGRDVVAWGGKAYAASTARDESYTISALTATAAGEATLKIIDMTNGEEPFQIKSYTHSYAINATATTICDALKALIAADQPSFANCDNTGVSSAIFDISGFISGATMNNGVVNKGKPTDFKVVFEDVNPTDAPRTLTTAVVGSYSVGVGEEYYVRNMEEELRGVNYGFYNRVELPNTPAASSVLSDNYDMYHIVATKDGSSASQIHGVDNLIEIYIAFDNADALGTGAVRADLENKLNGYLASVNFPSVNL